MIRLKHILSCLVAAAVLFASFPEPTSAAPEKSSRSERTVKKERSGRKSADRDSSYSRKKSSKGSSVESGRHSRRHRSSVSRDSDRYGSRNGKASRRSSRRDALERRGRHSDRDYDRESRRLGDSRRKDDSDRRLSSFIPEVPAPHSFRKGQSAYKGNLCPTVAMLGGEVVDIARQYMGTPYRSGGTTPRGFDCSGFVQWVFKRYGVKVPRSTYEQLEVGSSVPKSRLVPGDILVFRSSQARSGLHSGIYIGNDRFIHSPRTGDTVKTSRVSEGYFSGKLIAARRVLKAPPCDIELYAKPDIYRSHEMLDEHPFLTDEAPVSERPGSSKRRS